MSDVKRTEDKLLSRVDEMINSSNYLMYAKEVLELTQAFAALRAVRLADEQMSR